MLLIWSVRLVQFGGCRSTVNGQDEQERRLSLSTAQTERWYAAPLESSMLSGNLPPCDSSLGSAIMRETSDCTSGDSRLHAQRWRVVHHNGWRDRKGREAHPVHNRHCHIVSSRAVGKRYILDLRPGCSRFGPRHHVTASRLYANSPFRPLQPAWVGIKARPVYHQRLRTLCEQVAICIVIEVAGAWSRHAQAGARRHHRLAPRAHRLEAADCGRVSVGAQPNEHLLNAALGLPKAVPAQVEHVGEGLDVGHVRSGLEEAVDGAGFRRCEVGHKAVALAVGFKAHCVAHAYSAVVLL
eukprot:scaffold79564_cov78-Phaeocystis_antarctica.AAC.2